MKTLPFSILASLMAVSAFAADSSTQIKITDKHDELEDRDRTVLIQKKVNPKIDNDFEVVSDSDEVAGDPTTGWKAAYESWKQACADWKKEIRDDNKEGKVISISCGKAERETDGTGSGTYTYRSTGRYKVRVALKK